MTKRWLTIVDGLLKRKNRKYRMQTAKMVVDGKKMADDCGWIAEKARIESFQAATRRVTA